MVPVGGGAHRLYINGEMRKKANLTIGDIVNLRLTCNLEPRTLPMPLELKQALASSNRAEDAWRKLSPSHRNEILAYLNSLKKHESLERNSLKVLNRLLGQKTD